MGAVLRFQVLGPVAAYDERGAIALGPARHRTVLAALVIKPGGAVSVEELLERLWGSEPPARARETMYTYLSRLRGALAVAGGPPLVRRGRSYVLEAPPEAVDLYRFRELVRAARRTSDDARGADLWEEALALWQGPPLADLDGDWARSVAAALEAERLTATLDRNDVLLRRGEHSHLLPELTANAAAHPLDERIAGQLMLTLYRSGRQADALARYRSLTQRMADELGSDPGPLLQSLHQQILRQDPELSTPPVAAGDPVDGAAHEPAEVTPAQLPADVGGFAGRADLIRQLDELLGAPDEPPATVVITAVSGAGGIGKTTLAVHWAHRVRDRFPDGQLFVDLRGFDPTGQAMSSAEALRVLLEMLGVPPEQLPATVEAQMGLYRSRLAGTRTLVVLDNARDAAQVRPLLPGTPGNIALVTSRARLEGLAATDGARLMNLDTLTDGEARRLLSHRLGTERVAAEPDAVDAVIAACGGLPLALAIVAARAATTPTFPLAALATELADARDRLDALAGPDAASDVRAVFSWSYDAVSPPAARMFRLLGLHPGPDIGLNAVTNLAGVPMSQARRTLGELTRAHLVTEHAPGRYASHDLLRAYATELACTIDAEDDRRAARHRMLDYYLHSTAAADRWLPTSREATTLSPPPDEVTVETFASNVTARAWLTAEIRVLLAIIDQNLDGGFDAHVQQLARAVNTFLQWRGQWHDKITAQTASLRAARRNADLSGQATLHRGLAQAYERLGQRDQARSHIGQALALDDATGSDIGRARTLLTMVWLAERDGQVADGLRYARQCLDSARLAGDAVMQAIARNAIGWCHTLLGEHEQAITHCRQALAELQEIGGHASMSDVWNSLGHAHRHLGQYPQAVECYRQAVDWNHQHGSRWHEAGALVLLGDTHHDADNHDAARETWRQALRIFDEVGHPDADKLRERLAT